VPISIQHPCVSNSVQGCYETAMHVPDADVLLKRLALQYIVRVVLTGFKCCLAGCCQGGGHSPQLHDLPPGADGFLCVAEESDCTSVFSTLQLHDLDQVNFQDFSATSYSASHDSPLPPAASYASSCRIYPKSHGFTVAGW
jgi:hypothetical protein